jgi:hypothetical protein
MLLLCHEEMHRNRHLESIPGDICQVHLVPHLQQLTITTKKARQA